MKINVGSVVQLQSGGPSMTVTKVNVTLVNTEGYFLKCEWFLDGKPFSTYFPAESLALVDLSKEH